MWGNESGQHHQAGVHHQFRHFAHATNIFAPVVVGKTQVAAQAVTHVVTIQKIGADTIGVQCLFQRAGNGRFSRAGQPGKPQHHAFVAVADFAIRTRYRMRMPDHVVIIRPGRPQLSVGHVIFPQSGRARPNVGSVYAPEHSVPVQMR
ncbi:hypothetical protein D3C80_1177360 [compost metagenome]